MNKLFISTLAAALAVTSVSFGASKQMFCKTDLKDMKSCKNIPENRRDELGKLVAGGNPVAITNEKGNLTVWYTVGGADLQSCQVTSNVEEFKMSANPGDRSTAYFIRNGHMMDVKMEGSVAKGSCPKADKQDYNESLGLSGDQVVEMKVIPNGNSKIVAVGRTDNGYVIISKDSTIEKQFAGRSAEAAIDAIIEQSK